MGVLPSVSVSVCCFGRTTWQSWKAPPVSCVALLAAMWMPDCKSTVALETLVSGRVLLACGGNIAGKYCLFFLQSLSVLPVADAPCGRAEDACRFVRRTACSDFDCHAACCYSRSTVVLETL